MAFFAFYSSVQAVPIPAVNCPIFATHGSFSDFSENSIIFLQPSRHISKIELERVVHHIQKSFPNDLQVTLYEGDDLDENDGPLPVLELAHEILTKMRMQFQRETGLTTLLGQVNIRVTSNQAGWVVRDGASGRAGADHLHVHAHPNEVSFVLSLRGPGVNYMDQGRLRQAPPGQLVAFGGQVRHGSPDSDRPRLILVGAFRFTPPPP